MTTPTPGRTSILLAAALLLISPVPAFAQWVDQAVTLRPGWNSVYLTVEPESNRISDLLEGVPVKSVWCWNNKFTSVRYIDDPSELIPEKPGWFVRLRAILFARPADMKRTLAPLLAINMGAFGKTWAQLVADWSAVLKP